MTEHQDELDRATYAHLSDDPAARVFHTLWGADRLSTAQEPHDRILRMATMLAKLTAHLAERGLLDSRELDQLLIEVVTS